MHVSERTGVIVVRVWIEGDPHSGFRARVTATRDVSKGERTTIAAGSVEEVLRIVREWLEEFVGASLTKR